MLRSNSPAGAATIQTPPTSSASPSQTPNLQTSIPEMSLTVLTQTAGSTAEANSNDTTTLEDMNPGKRRKKSDQANSDHECEEEWFNILLQKLRRHETFTVIRTVYEGLEHCIALRFDPFQLIFFQRTGGFTVPDELVSQFTDQLKEHFNRPSTDDVILQIPCTVDGGLTSTKASVRATDILREILNVRFSSSSSTPSLPSASAPTSSSAPVSTFSSDSSSSTSSAVSPASAPPTSASPAPITQVFTSPHWNKIFIDFRCDDSMDLPETDPAPTYLANISVYAGLTGSSLNSLLSAGKITDILLPIKDMHLRTIRKSLENILSADQNFTAWMHHFKQTALDLVGFDLTKVTPKIDTSWLRYNGSWLCEYVLLDEALFTVLSNGSRKGGKEKDGRVTPLTYTIDLDVVVWVYVSGKGITGTGVIMTEKSESSLKRKNR